MINISLESSTTAGISQGTNVSGFNEVLRYLRTPMETPTSVDFDRGFQMETLKANEGQSQASMSLFNLI